MPDKKTVVTLRTVADRVKLAPCSVSAVLNNTPASWSIPQRTKDRVLRAAAQLNYRPNFSARSLRTKRTHMVAVVSSDFGLAPVARVLAGMERALRKRGYLLILRAVDGDANWDRICVDFQQRGIEGVLAVGTPLQREVELPVVSVDLGYMSPSEPLAEGMNVWLTELGESAVGAVLSQIETKADEGKTRITKTRITKIVPKFPPAFANMPGFALPIARLGSQAEIVEAS